MAKARKKLEGWQIEDAERLRALWDKRQPKISQLDAAAEWLGAKTQGSLEQYVNGRIPLNLPVVLKFATGLKCLPGDISPTLAAQLPTDIPATVAASASNDARAITIAEQFRFLTEPQKKKIYLDVTSMAAANKALMEQMMGQQLTPPPDVYVDKVLNGKRQKQRQKS